jgi:hypothetical protein
LNVAKSRLEESERIAAAQAVTALSQLAFLPASSLRTHSSPGTAWRQCRQNIALREIRRLQKGHRRRVGPAHVPLATTPEAKARPKRITASTVA